MARLLLQEARAEAAVDFALVNPIAAAASGMYEISQSVVIDPLNFFKKLVTGTVTWQGEYGQDLSVNLSTLITNPEALNGGDTCGSVLLGDWTNPQKTEYEFGAEIL